MVEQTYFGTETARMAKFLEVPSCNNVCSSYKGVKKKYSNVNMYRDSNFLKKLPLMDS